MSGMLGPRLDREKVRRPDLADTEPLRCRHCRRHTVAWSGAFWVCTRLEADPTTGEDGCGRQFVPDCYQTPPKENAR